MLARRGLLTGLTASGVLGLAKAPAIVRSGLIMPIKAVKTPVEIRTIKIPVRVVWNELTNSVDSVEFESFISSVKEIFKQQEY